MPILSDTKIRSSKPTDKNYRLHDGRGLYLEVRKTGSKYWRLRIREGGKDTYHTLGQYPGVGLSEARKKSDAIRTGEIDISAPVAVVETFKDIATEWYLIKFPGWSERYANQVRGCLDKDIFPAIGASSMAAITSRDILDIMKALEDRGAKNVAIWSRQWIHAIYAHAIRTLRAEYDPTQALIGAVSPAAPKHATSLSRDQLKRLLKDINQDSAYRSTIIAMKLLAHTMLRTAEIRHGEWSEIDWDQAIWTIPASKMKKRVPHIVPLSSQVVSLLKELHSITGHGKWLVPNQKRFDQPMTATSINTALARMGWRGTFSAHGFRATASTILNQSGYRGDLIEKQLAHSSGNRVRAAYNHADYLDERRNMLQWWSDYLERLEKE